MTRTDRWAEKRADMVIDNLYFMANHFDLWMEMKIKHAQIKKKGGYRH